MHSTLANGLALGKAYNGDVLTIASSLKHHVYCILCNVLDTTCMPECPTGEGHTGDIHLVQEPSGLKREVKRVADALEELIAMKRANTDSEVKSEVPSEDATVSDSVLDCELHCTTFACFPLCCFTWSEGVSGFSALIQLRPPLKLQLSWNETFNEVVKIEGFVEALIEASLGASLKLSLKLH